MVPGEGAKGQTMTWKRKPEHLKNITNRQSNLAAQFLWSELSSIQTPSAHGKMPADPTRPIKPKDKQIKQAMKDTPSQVSDHGCIAAPIDMFKLIHFAVIWFVWELKGNIKHYRKFRSENTTETFLIFFFSLLMFLIIRVNIFFCFV